MRGAISYVAVTQNAAIGNMLVYLSLRMLSEKIKEEVEYYAVTSSHLVR